MINAKQYQRINTIAGWCMFLFTCSVYWLTAEPTISFWDCGEFLSCADKLQIAHSPGSPLFLMIGRLFMMMTSDVSQQAVMFNHWSNIVSGLSVMFLFWTVTHLARKLLVKSNEDLTSPKVMAIIGAGLVGAAALTFCDSFWFSAVEAIVWASSSIFYSVVFWAIMKWENEADQPKADRWLIFIAFIVGLSIGVHLLCLLVIPSVVMVAFFRKNPNFTRWQAIRALLLSFILLGSIQYIFIQGLPKAAAKWDIFFVNSLGLPFDSGAIFWIIVLAVVLIYLLLATSGRVTSKFVQPVAIAFVSLFITLYLIENLWIGLIVGVILAFGVNYMIGNSKYKSSFESYPINTAALMVLMLMLGYSSYIEVVVRANANPAINMGNPNNAFDLVGYLDREQYGTQPFLYGPYYNTNVVAVDSGEKQYHKGDKNYIYVGEKPKFKYDPAGETLFPRIWDNDDPSHVKFYQAWLGYSKNQQPTFIDNIKFFIGYQCYYMYFRYFMWNFAGRQNDYQGYSNSDLRNGNWLSGISFIDNARLGPQDQLPPDLAHNRAHNVYYFLPLLLGLLGAYFQYKRSPHDFWPVALFWFLTGLGIIIFLNQTPLQPRERDYSYAASFYAFCIWIGLGTIAIFDYFSKKTKTQTAALGAIALSLIVPVLMGTQNWNDHDRSKRRTAHDLGLDYLQSCAPNAILFTQGDNDTYPLWYAQEVEHIRPDIRVVNLSLLGVDWYIDELKHKVNESAPIDFSLTPDKYQGDKRDFVVYNPQGGSDKKVVSLKDLINFLGSDNSSTQVQLGMGGSTNFFPTKNVFIPVDKKAVLANGTVDAKDSNRIVNQVQWTIPKNTIDKNDLVELDIIASNCFTRPIYFSTLGGTETYLGIQDYLQQEGLCTRIVPIRQRLNDGLPGFVNADLMYDNMMNKFSYGNVDKEHLNLDSWNIIPMWDDFRTLFGRMAEGLIAEGKKDSAEKALNKALEVTPYYNVPPSVNEVSFVGSYYGAGDSTKAREVAKTMLDFANNWLKYISSLDPDEQSSYQRDEEESLYAIQQLMMDAQTFNDKQLTDMVTPVYNKYQNLFQQFGRQQ